jgi:hypothetical protein
MMSALNDSSSAYVNVSGLTSQGTGASFELWLRLTETIATSLEPYDCVGFCLEVLALLPCEHEASLVRGLTVLLKRTDQKAQRHLNAAVDNKSRDQLKTVLDTFDRRHKFKGKV